MALSAPLLARKRIIKVKIETDKGDKVAGDQALMVFDLVINPTAPFEARNGTGLYRGGKETGVLGERSGVCSFRAEMRGTGSSGLEAGLAILLQASGFAKASEVYQVHSTHTNDKTISIDVWEDGVKKGLAGASGNVTFEGEFGKVLYLNFEFTGIWQAPIDEAMPAYAPSTTAPMKLAGGTFTLATETIKVSRFSLNMGNVVVPRADIAATGGIAYYMITDYEPELGIDPEADLIAGYDYNGLWLAGTAAAVSLSVTDGTDKVTFTIPVVQYKEIPGGEREGILTYDITGQCLHSSGNDSVKLEAAAAA